MNRASKFFALIAMGPLVAAAVLAFVPQGLWLLTALLAIPLIVAWDFRDQRKAELDEIEAFANTTPTDREGER